MKHKDAKFTDTTGPFSFVLRAFVVYSCRFFRGVLVLSVFALPGRAREHPDYRNPPRSYDKIVKGDLIVYVERPLLDDDPQTAERAIARLVKAREAAMAVFPAPSREELREIPFYLMMGPKARGGGMGDGLQCNPAASPDNNPKLDPNWGNAIVVHSADNYARITDFWALKALVHEYSHAHHLLHWIGRQPEILSAWQNAMARGLYRNVSDERGRRRDLAYAGVNQFEYFAELSAMYFVGCNYPPRTRAELERYDPVGAQMVRTMWGLDGAESPPDTRKGGER